MKEMYKRTALEIVIFKTGDVITTSLDDDYEGWNPHNTGSSDDDGYEGWNPHSP